ncbi:MAG: hypothetical protein WD939_08125, partial [Dehalococcoidia bacterium]
MDDGGRSDDQLAAAVAGGDDAALGELYHRYFASLYDFALRLTRDRNVAALVVQSAFLRAFQGLRAGESQASFKLQLFGGAHHDVAEQLRRRREPAPEPDESFTAADPAGLAQPVAAGELTELAGIAWQAAREQKLNDYELIDLNVRRRLDDVEIATILRTRREAVGNRVVSVVDDFEGAYSALLLAGPGRRSCVDLDFVIGDSPWSPALKRRVQRHLGSCQTCRETRGRYPGATDVLAALTDAPAPEGWQNTILGRLTVAVSVAAVAAVP